MSRSVSPRVKDPKRVSAGRAGAAARNAKQQKLLDELRETKAALAPLTEREAARAPTTTVVLKETADPEVAVSSDSQSHTAAARTDWIPRIVGGLGLAGVVWFLHGNCFAIPSSGVAAPPKASAPSPAGTAAKQPVASKQLETSSDPFYME